MKVKILSFHRYYIHLHQYFELLSISGENDIKVK